MADKRTQLETVIQTAINSMLKEVHTCLPAVVEEVNHSTQLIKAQTTIKRKLKGELVDLPVLVDVPIRYLRSNTFSFTFPIEVGDYVLLIFAERSIDTWLQNGGFQNPSDIRKFSLSDAFAFPMMYPNNDVIPNFDNTNLEIKTNSGSTKIIIKASEDVEIITTGEVKADCNTAIVNATTKVDITTPKVTITGDLEVTGKIDSPVINASSTMSVNSKDIETHIHSQPNDGGGDIEQNTSGIL